MPQRAENGDHDRYRLWLNDEQTILVREWSDGQMEIAFRPDPGATWGPPMKLLSEEQSRG